MDRSRRYSCEFGRLAEPRVQGNHPISKRYRNDIDLIYRGNRAPISKRYQQKTCTNNYANKGTVTKKQKQGAMPMGMCRTIVVSVSIQREQSVRGSNPFANPRSCLLSLRFNEVVQDAFPFPAAVPVCGPAVMCGVIRVCCKYLSVLQSPSLSCHCIDELGEGQEGELSELSVLSVHSPRRQLN